jgi:hypothetical protein
MVNDPDRDIEDAQAVGEEHCDQQDVAKAVAEDGGRCYPVLRPCQRTRRWYP